MKEQKKKFVKKSILIIIMLAIIIFLLNQIYINIVEKNQLVYRKEAEWQAYKGLIPNTTLDYAFFGDSHAMNALNPLYIDNSFNFATAGEDYIETYFKVKKILEKDNIYIKNIVLEIDTHTFSAKTRTDDRLFRGLGYFSTFMDLKTIADLKGEKTSAIYVQTNIRVFGKGEEILYYFLSPPEFSETFKGWANSSYDFSKLDREKVTALKYDEFFSKSYSMLEPKRVEYFNKILSLAQEKGINVILIKYPMSYEYDMELRKHNISREEYYTELFRMVNKSDSEYLVMDYYDIFFQNPEYMGDSDHVNYKGSEILSKKFADDMDEIRKE